MPQFVCDSFRVELLQAVHNFNAGTGDTFKLALYEEGAPVGSGTTVYSATGESVGAGYTAGGLVLSNISPVSIGGVGVASFADANFGVVTLTYRYALLYNSTKNNRAVAVFDFGSQRSVVGSTLILQMPPLNPTNAIVRVN